MGHFGITRKALYEALSNMVGVRVGLALGEPDLQPHVDSRLADLGPALTDGLRLGSDEYQMLMLSILQETGDPWMSFGYVPQLEAFRRMGSDTHLYVVAHDAIHDAAHRQNLVRFEHSGQCSISDAMESAPLLLARSDSWLEQADLNRLDESDLLGRVSVAHGSHARSACEVLLYALRCKQHINPWASLTHQSSKGLLALRDLFETSGVSAADGTFFDQRFVNYLAQNLDQTRAMHWRQFERMIAEFFRREGYDVELGPGSNDDGVDIRAWPREFLSGRPPLTIIQCKRQAADVDKTVVKALWADMKHETATSGVVATTSRLAPGAQETVEARGYPVSVVDANSVRTWLTAMRTPGAGIRVL